MIFIIMGNKSVRTEWTDSEIKILKKNYSILSNNELSLLLNKTKKNVIRTLKYLNLSRDLKSRKQTTLAQ